MLEISSHYPPKMVLETGLSLMKELIDWEKQGPVISGGNNLSIESTYLEPLDQMV